MHTGQPFRLPARSEVCDASGVLKSGRCPRLVGVEDQIECGQRALCLSKVRASQRVDRGRDPLLAQQHPYVGSSCRTLAAQARASASSYGTSPSQLHQEQWTSRSRWDGAFSPGPPSPTWPAPRCARRVARAAGRKSAIEKKPGHTTPPGSADSIAWKAGAPSSRAAQETRLLTRLPRRPGGEESYPKFQLCHSERLLTAPVLGIHQGPS